MGKHALLSASSSHRWLACPPSARLCENYEDTGSEYAQQGTDAHSLCEHKLKQAFGMETTDPTESLNFYDEEMEECACGYAEYVLSMVEEAKKTCKDPVVLIEQKLDFSRFVKDGFGTGDCVIIADGTLYIIDYKHGKGVEVSAVENPQMMLYALGALELFDGIYDIDTVRMAIYQRAGRMLACASWQRMTFCSGRTTTLWRKRNLLMTVRVNSKRANTVASVRQKRSAGNVQNITWNLQGMILKCPPRWKMMRLQQSL